MLMIQQRGAIDEFIRKRLTSIGPNGVSAAAPVISDASKKEIEGKTIEDVKQSPFEIQENVRKVVPNSRNEMVIEKFKKVQKIESIVQTYLMAEYGSKYKPNIKITREDKSIILDGLITLNSGKYKAVEIRYISGNKHPEVLRFIVGRLKNKLFNFGINKISLVVVGDGMLPQDVKIIRDSLIGISQSEFLNIKGEGLERVDEVRVDTSQAQPPQDS